MGEQINPETIERLGDAPAAIRVLLNTVEELLQPNQALRDEVQEWKDEVNRLKEEQGKRSIKPSKHSKPRNHSSERECKGPKERRKGKKRGKSKIHATTDNGQKQPTERCRVQRVCRSSVVQESL